MALYDGGDHGLLFGAIRYADGDWFRILVDPQQTVTVETSSTGGPWRTDTAIDLSDAEMGYVKSNNDKSQESTYSILSFANPTDTPATFYIMIKPHARFDHAPLEYGEYTVEFR